MKYAGRIVRNRVFIHSTGSLNYCFFSKRGEKSLLICGAAVKPEGRSPESKPLGAAWLDGKRGANRYNAPRPLGKNNSLYKPFLFRR